MTDVEKLFAASGGPKPRRPLRADFTHNVTDYVSEHPRKRGLARIMEIKYMRFFTKPVFAAAAITVALVASGASAFAAVGGWPGISAMFGGQQDLPNGDRIVRVDTDNCLDPHAFNMPELERRQDKHNTVYYKLKAESKLTNEQVVQMVRGNCFVQEQAAYDQKVLLEALEKNPLNKNAVVGGYIDSEVTAISDKSISLKSIIPYGIELKTVEQTFNNIDPDVFVYQSPNRLSLSDIKVGDHVSIKYRTTGDALAHSETIMPDKIATDEQTIVAIFKNSADATAAVDYQKYNGAEFEQVAPCDREGGYCTYAQLLGKE